MALENGNYDKLEWVWCSRVGGRGRVRWNNCGIGLLLYIQLELITAKLAATAPLTVSILALMQCVTNTMLMSEYEYEYLRVDFLWQIRIRIYLDPIS